MIQTNLRMFENILIRRDDASLYKEPDFRCKQLIEKVNVGLYIFKWLSISEDC